MIHFYKPLISILAILPSFLFSNICKAQEIEKVSFSSAKYTEYAPSISTDGKKMVFQSNENSYRNWYLFECRLNEQGKWSNPKPIQSINAFGTKPVLENQFEGDYIACPSLSRKGDTLYFCANFEGGTGKRDIYYVYIQPDGEWSKPVNLSYPINSSENEDSPSLSPDGQSLYFTRYAENPHSKDSTVGMCYAIYVSRKDVTGSWTSPLKLPGIINAGCEKAPRIQPDDVTLLFSSARKGSKGSYDLYYTVADIRGKWSEPRPLDFINSPGFEQFACIPVAEDRLYYCTLGKESPDIFTYTPIPEWLMLQKFAPAKLHITDKNNTNSVQAQITVRLDEPDQFLLKTINADWIGNAVARLRLGYRYKVQVKADGFIPENILIDLSNAQKTDTIFKEVQLLPDSNLLANNLTVKNETTLVKNTNINNLQMKISTQNKNNPYQKRIDAGENLIYFDSLLTVNTAATNEQILEKFLGKGDVTLIFNHINFAFSSSTLEQKYFDDLEAILLLMKAQKNLHLVISAHTDDVGPDDYNLKLSEERAKAVKYYIYSKGIEENRLISNFFGESEPLFPNTNEENRTKNRRVEIKIIHDKK